MTTLVFCVSGEVGRVEESLLFFIELDDSERMSYVLDPWFYL